jgi:hypothetical protein
VARFGWTAAEPGRLHCASCSASLDIDEPALLFSADVRDSVYSALSSGHIGSCVWKATQAPTLFLQLPREPSLVHLEVSQRVQQLNSLSILPGPLHCFDSHFLVEWQSAISENAEHSTQAIYDSLSEHERTTLALAVCGWTVSPSFPSHLSCCFCAQSVEATEFQHFHRSANSNNSDSDSAAPSARFHPALEHRFFCLFSPPIPFESSSSASNAPADSLPGWRRVLTAWFTRERLLRRSASPSSAAELKQKTMENVRKIIFLME